MCDILERLHQYVPTTSTKKSVQLPDGRVIMREITDMFEQPLGGDLLSVVRARSACAIRANHHTSKDQLKGFFPVLEDWHTCQTLMKVFYRFSVDIP
jgi:hypothetical protein